jgi:hypothetical protein
MSSGGNAIRFRYAFSRLVFPGTPLRSVNRLTLSRSGTQTRHPLSKTLRHPSLLYAVTATKVVRWGYVELPAVCVTNSLDSGLGTRRTPAIGKRVGYLCMRGQRSVVTFQRQT